MFYFWVDISFKKKIVFCDIYVLVILVYVLKEKFFEYIVVRRNNVIYGSIVFVMGKFSFWVLVELMSWNVIFVMDESCV